MPSRRPERPSELRIADLRPIEMSAHQSLRPELRKLSDHELLESATNPQFDDPLVVNTVTGLLYDGNGRANELSRRAADPESTITADLTVPVEYYTPDLSMFPDARVAGEEEERNREEREAVRALDQVLREDLGIEEMQVGHERDAAHQQRERDRDAERHQQHAAEKQREDHIFTASASNSVVLASRIAVVMARFPLRLGSCTGQPSAN